ncbi:MAG: hypothetical protein J5748_01895 [Bacteroidales bacterium]|nr:hypothetical protein [Bacteroidales bacterium]
MKHLLPIWALALALFVTCSPEPAGPEKPNDDKPVQVDTSTVDPTPVIDSVALSLEDALLLDFVFDDDGTAHDASKNKCWIDSKLGVNMMTYYNASAERNVARFFNSLGGLVDEGFYKFAYSSNTWFKDRLADGHSLEVLFMMGDDPGDVGEIKMFSSMEAGGTGFLVTDKSRGREITFLPNTTFQNEKNWRWCRSGVVPEVGKYYHVVGVWDKEAGKARIYVDGVLKKTVDAPGTFNFPNGAASNWICVGGDPSGSSCQSAWNGDVVIARVYDAALDDAQAAKLWELAPKIFKASSIQLSNVLFFPECEVKRGGYYTISGDGFVTGDMILLEGDELFECTTEVKIDRVVITIPVGFKSGTYKIFLVRGAESAPIGSARLTVTDSPRELFAPKVVAHRGFHGANRPENSIAALKAAQDGGFYGSELDVWMTTDGKLFVNHDGVISGKRIQDCTSAELEGITLSNGESLPTFRQYLDQAVKNLSTRLVIEVKQHSTEQRNLDCTQEMLNEVDEYGIGDSVDYISFDWGICTAIAARKPGATVGYLTSTKDLENLASHGINCADFAYTYLFLNPDLFDKAHSLGMKIDIWTIDAPSEMMRAIGLGADYITTNKPDVLQNIVERLF